MRVEWLKSHLLKWRHDMETLSHYWNPATVWFSNAEVWCLILLSPLSCQTGSRVTDDHDDVIKWKHFPRYWPFVRGIHRSPVNSPHKSQWRGALMFSLIWVWINGWINTREAGDLRRYRVHCDVAVMFEAGRCPYDCNVSLTFRWRELEQLQSL